MWKILTHTHTHPCTHFTLPEPALLSDLVRPAELLHVLAEVTLSAVLRPHAGLTLPAHARRALNLRAWKNKNAFIFSPNANNQTIFKHAIRLRRFTRDPRRRSFLKSIMSFSSCRSISSPSDSLSRLFLVRYLISKESSLPRKEDKPW